jgi:hypothetical protein
MKYDVYLMRKAKSDPVESIFDVEIPDNLLPEQRIVFAAHEIMKKHRIEIIPVEYGESFELKRLDGTSERIDPKRITVAPLFTDFPTIDICKGEND